MLYELERKLKQIFVEASSEFFFITLIPRKIATGFPEFFVN